MLVLRPGQSDVAAAVLEGRDDATLKRERLEQEEADLREGEEEKGSSGSGGGGGNEEDEDDDDDSVAADALVSFSPRSPHKSILKSGTSTNLR